MFKTFTLLLLLIVSGILISIIPYSWMSTWSGLLFNAMHFPAFAILGFLLRRVKIVNNIKVLLSWLSLPIIIELLQLFVGRSADIVDLLWGYVGLLSGLYFQWRFKWLLGAIIGIYISWLAYLITDAITPYKHLPIVADFESPSEFNFIRSIGKTPQDNLKVTPHSASDNHYLSVHQGKYPWTGLYIPYNWRINLTPYQGIRLNLRSSVPVLPVDIKLDDGENKIIYSFKHKNVDWQAHFISFKKETRTFNWERAHSISIYVDSSLLEQPLDVDDISFY